MIPFFDRGLELAALEDFLASSRAELCFVNGKPQTGKSRLLREWLSRHSDVPTLYWQAASTDLATEYERFVPALERFAAALGLAGFKIPSAWRWQSAFTGFGQIAAHVSRPIVLVIEEFTNWVRLERAMASHVQIAWDHHLQHIPNVRIVLTGSALRVMRHDVLSYQAPLYGRATCYLHLKPLSFFEMSSVFSNWSLADRMALYALTGGMPTLLDPFVGAKNFRLGLNALFTSLNELLPRPLYLFRGEVPSIALTERVLQAIARGAQHREQIVQAIGRADRRLTMILKRLVVLEVLEEHEPLLAAASRADIRYTVCDPIARFHYRYVYLSAVAQTDAGRLQKVVRRDLKMLAERTVQRELIALWLHTAHAQKRFGFWIEKTGLFLNPRAAVDSQVTMIGLNRQERRMIIARTDAAASGALSRIIEELTRECERQRQQYPGWKIEPILFSLNRVPRWTRASGRHHPPIISFDEMETDLLEEINSPPSGKEIAY